MPENLLKVQTAEAQVTPQKELASLSSKEDFVAYIEKEAPKYGLSAKKVESRIECETGGTWNPSVVGDHGTSFGLAQLHNPSTKGLTIAQAEDPKTAIDYMIQNWHKDRWSCP